MSGAIKCAITAGALNMATNTLRSIGDGISRGSFQGELDYYAEDAYVKLRGACLEILIDILKDCGD